jgi:hypothetical protein
MLWWNNALIGQFQHSRFKYAEFLWNTPVRTIPEPEIILGRIGNQKRFAKKINLFKVRV